MGKGLLMLAGVFVVLGAAGILLTPLVPTLIGLGIAIGLLGLGMLAAGVGVLAFATGLTALGVAGAAATAGIVAIVSGLLGLLPMVAEQIGRAIIAFAKVIATAGPAVTEAIVAVLMALMNAIVRLTPKIVDTLLRMLLMLLNALNNYMPKLQSAGIKLIVSLLNGVASKIGGVITAATNLVVAFLNGISKNQGRIIQSGVSLIISFINGMASAIRSNSSAMGAAGGNLASAIIEGMADVARSALNAAKSVLGISSPSKEFQKLGQYVNDGFRKGLDGNKSSIDSSYANLKKMLYDMHVTAVKSIVSLEAKLKKLNKAKKKDTKAIAATKKALALAKLEDARAKNAFNTLTKGLNDENAALGKLANQYDVITKKIEDARQKLADATKTRDDYSASIRDQYNDLPETSGQVTLAKYVDDLRKQIVKTQEFATKIQKLRSLGLNDTLYKELLAKGPETMPFIDELLASGRKGVEVVNKLGGSLEWQAKDLGLSASKALYQAGVDAAAGLVKGLQNQQAALEKQMDKLADAMVKAIKFRLGIKSPSKEFAKIGGYSVEGLAQGLKATSIVAEKSAEQVGKDALSALQSTLSNVAWSSGRDMNIQPTIRPVLDLTDVRNGASKIPGLLGQKMTAIGSYQRAAVISAAVRTNEATRDAQIQATQAATLSYTQINNSPKALSSAEIYRQTKNQLSVVKKGALTP
jgi:predicted  nucleic acid-binding Zn-ribbon protein